MKDKLIDARGQAHSKDHKRPAGIAKVRPRRLLSVRGEVEMTNHYRSRKYRATAKEKGSSVSIRNKRDKPRQQLYI